MHACLRRAERIVLQVVADVENARRWNSECLGSHLEDASMRFGESHDARADDNLKVVAQASALEGLIDDKTRRSTLGRAAQARARERFSAEVIVPRYEALYRRLCR